MAKQARGISSSKLDKKRVNRGEIVDKVVFPDRATVLQSNFRSDEAVGAVSLSEGKEPPVYYVAANAADKVFPKIINDDKNFHRLIDATRNGLPYKSLHNAQGIMPFSTQEWAQILHVSKRSIERLKKEKRKLNSTQSEKLIEVTLLYDFGVDVFGSSEKFSKWLNRNSIALGGVAPKSLLDTIQGINAVNTELSRIEYGVLA